MSDNFQNRYRPTSSALADAFHSWERHGRGWMVWDYAVELEPPFRPVRIMAPVFSPLVDDARVATGRRGLLPKARDARGPALGQDDEPIEPPASFYRTGQLAELRMLLPHGFDVSPPTVMQFLQSVSNCKTPIAFELVADRDSIRIQMACDAQFAEVLKTRVTTFFPGISVLEERDFLRSHFSGGDPYALADFGLARSLVLPLNTFRGFDPEPMTGLLASLAGLKNADRAVFQVLFQSTRHRWDEELQRVTAHPDVGSAIQANGRAISDKLNSPFFAVVIRIVVQSATERDAWQILRNIGANLSLFSNPAGNELIALSNDGLPTNNHFLSLVNRTSYRSGMILNCSELASFVHPPSRIVGIEKLKRAGTRTKAPPANSAGGTLLLGVNKHDGKTTPVTLSTEQRLKHTHVIGATGSGKSTLLVRMMVQDAEQGRGFGAFDPHGDLIDTLLERIPEDRAGDVILFDPSDGEFPIGLNVLAAHSELERTLLSSDLVSIFRKFSSSWGDVMNSVLSNAVLAFLESDRGGSILDLKRFLVERSFRQDFLQTVRDEEVRYYWEYEFPQIRGKPYAPLLTRLDTFLRSRLIRHIVAQKENKLDFRRILDERKILLARLSHGAVGIENAYLLGSLLVARIYHAALSRQDIPEANRQPFFLYLDEAHHFVTESMSQILSGARKFGLGLLVSHQQLRQFRSGEEDVLASILSNTFARVCFRLDEDAEKLAKGFSFFNAEHLRNLSVGSAICRFEQSRYDLNLETYPLESIPGDIAERRRSAIVENSRRLYAKPRKEVEAEARSLSPLPTTRQIEISTQTKDIRTVEPTPINAPAAGSARPDTTASIVATRSGRGGAHHREMQAVIRRMGESYGFVSEIEKELPGAGRIDVSLTKDELKIACEVSVTTDSYEIVNTLKCLAAGYDFAVVVSSNEKKIPLLQRKLDGEIPIDLQSKVRVVSLMDLLSFLRGLSGTEQSDEKRKGFKGRRLSFADACDVLGKSPSTLYRWLREGRVPFYRVGREYEFDRDELLLMGKQDLSAKRKPVVKLSPLTIEKSTPKTKKEQDTRYRKLLKLDKMDEPPLRTRREKEANGS